MWQVSDYAPPQVVQAVSGLCDNSNRTYSVRYLGGTLMGASSWYEPDGTYHLRDPNMNQYEVWCSCGKKWHVWASGRMIDDSITIHRTEQVNKMPD